jgi:hypothetical protein
MFVIGVLPFLRTEVARRFTASQAPLGGSVHYLLYKIFEGKVQGDEFLLPRHNPIRLISFSHAYSKSCPSQRLRKSSSRRTLSTTRCAVHNEKHISRTDRWTKRLSLKYVLDRGTFNVLHLFHVEVDVRTIRPQPVAIDQTSIIPAIEFPLLFTIGMNHVLECGEANMVALLWRVRAYTHMLIDEEEKNLFEVSIQVRKEALGQVDANLAVHIGLARASFGEGLADVVKEAEEKGDLGADTITLRER